MDHVLIYLVQDLPAVRGRNSSFRQAFRIVSIRHATRLHAVEVVPIGTSC